MPDTEPSAADRGVGVQPDEIWSQVSRVEHMTSLASARRIWDDEGTGVKVEQDNTDDAEADDAESDDRGHFALTPSLGTDRSTSLIFALRANGRFDCRHVAFEEAAQVHFDDGIGFEREDLERFGTRFIIPFLLPYVESGFTRMCAEIGVEPPQFPMFTFNGEIYTFEPPTSGRHAADKPQKE